MCRNFPLATKITSRPFTRNLIIVLYNGNITATGLIRQVVRREKQPCETICSSEYILFCKVPVQVFLEFIAQEEKYNPNNFALTEANSQLIISSA